MSNFDDVFKSLQKLNPEVRRIMDIDDVESVSTGFPWVDFVTGIGGIPRGRVTEIFGVESIGKTSLALYTIAEAQRNGLVTAFIDVEYAIAPDHLAVCGVDTEHMIFYQPNSAEDALNHMDIFSKQGVDLIVLDSVAKLLPRVEDEADFGKAQYALNARLMSQGLRKLVPIFKKNNTAAIFINQIRANVGAGLYGPKEITPGGFALRFDASIRIELRPGGALKEGDSNVGHTVRVKIVKNKVGVPKKFAQFNIRYKQPIQREDNLIEIAKLLDFVQARGGHYYLMNPETGEQEEKIAHGMANVIKRLQEEPELYDTINKRVLASRDKLRLGFGDEEEDE